MTAIAFTVPGDARGWARARINTRGAHPVHFMDRHTRSYENLVKLAGAEAMRGRAPLDAPCELYLTVRKAPPKTASRKVRADMLAGILRPGVKPDASNIAKGVEDALNGITYRDDALIVELHVSKFYAETPGLDIVIRPYDVPVDPGGCAPAVYVERAA